MGLKADIGVFGGSGFYNFLEDVREVKIETPYGQPSDKVSIARVAQLTQKTNQFNLTTHRYSERDINNFVCSNDHLVYCLRLSDRFGESGNVGVIIVEKKKYSWIIDTFLLSCRVIGRGVEKLFLAYLMQEAKKCNVKDIIGMYIPTKKNELVANFYKDQNFKEINGKWFISTMENIIFPEWILVNE